MFRNNPRIKRDARRGAQNVSSTDIVDFPDHPVDREFIMWSEAQTRWVMSGKDAVSTQEMEDRIQQLINGAPGTLDTLKELADTLGDPNNIATDVITKLNIASEKTNKITITEPISLDAIDTRHYADLSVTTAKIGPEAVTTSKIQQRAVGDAQIALNSLYDYHLRTDSVITSKIQDLSVTTAKINTGAVTTMKIGNSQVITEKIADNSITTSKIVNKNITREKMADNVIDTLQLETASVTNLKMAANSVTTPNIVNANITQPKMAANSVGTLQIINGNITNPKMATNSVTTQNITDLNVTTAKLEDSAVTTEKILNSSVITSKLANLNVTTAKIAYNAVTNDQIAARTINSNRLVEKTISNLEMNDNSIHTRNLLDSCVTSDKIADNTIVHNDLSNNCVITSKIKNSNVTTEKIADNAVVTAKVLNRNITSEKIAQNAVTEFELNTNAVLFEHIKDSNVLTNAIANRNVTYEKIQNVPAASILLRNSNDAGPVGDFLLNDKQILIGNGMGFTAADLKGEVTMENDGAVTINNNAITRNKIHNREVITEKIAARAVTNNEIAVKTILGGAVGNIAFDTIHSDNIKPGEIKNTNLANNSVQTLNIADRNVTTEKIANDGVTNNELADDAVKTSNIVNLNVTNEKIAANAVDTNKIHNLSVTNIKLSDNSVSTGKIIDHSVILDKIQQVNGNTILVRDTDTTGVLSQKTIGDKELLIGNGSGFNTVTLTKDVTMDHDGLVTISDNAVKTNTINAAAITQAKMANDSVGTNQVIQNSITGGNTGKIALDTIDNTNIKNNAIKTGHITDSSVITSKVQDNAIVMAKLSNAIQTKLQSFSQGTGGTPASLDQIAINKDNIQSNENAITTLTNGAPELLNTLNELANAIGDDENFTVTITEQLNNRMQMGVADDPATHITQDIFGVKKFANAIVGDITGEAATAKKLSVNPATGLPVTIAGKSFDGTANITITTADITGLTPGSNHIIEVAERNKLAAIEEEAQKTNFTNIKANGGVMTTTDQTISGVKTFSNKIIASQTIEGDITGQVLVSNQTNITRVGTLVDLEVTGDILGNSDIKANGDFESQNGNLTIKNITASGDINAVGDIEAANFVAVAADGNGVNVGNFTGNLIGNVDGNAATATKFAKTDLTIGGVAFDGTASINLNGVNQIGDQDTTGNAATATSLKTSIKIGNVDFDGSADITPINTQVALDDDSNANKHISFTTSGGNQQTLINSSLLYNPNTSILYVPKIQSELTGNVIGDLTGKILSNAGATIINSIDKSAHLDHLTLSGNTTFGANSITGTAGSIVSATTLIGTIQTAAQPNITSVGSLSSLTLTGDINIGSNNIIGGANSEIIADTFTGNLTGVASSATSLAGTLTIAGKDVVFAANGNAVVTIDDLANGGVLKITGDTTQTVLGTKIFNNLKLGNTLDGNSQNISNVGIVAATSFNGTLIQAAQPNITSVGILNGLTLSDDIDMSNKNITNTNAVTATTFNGDLIGNADTVTNGAYITADNQFGGSNTFLNKLTIANGIEFTGGDLKLQTSNLDTNGNITCNNITATGTLQGTASFVQDGVYLSTTQTISGNKTFTGNNTFTKAIDAPSGLNGEASSVTDGVYASIGNSFTGTGNEFLNALSCPGGVSGNASSATILRDTRTIGSNIGNLGNPAQGGTVGGSTSDFNGSQNVTLTPQHVGISTVSNTIADTTIISEAERLQLNTNTADIATNSTRITNLIGGAPESLDTLKEISDYLNGSGDGADGVAGGLVTSLAGKVNTTGDETIGGVKTFTDGIVIGAGNTIAGIVTTATNLNSDRKIGNSSNWAATRDLDAETGNLIELTPQHVGLVVASNNLADMSVITAAERLKIANIAPDGGLNTTSLSAVGCIMNNLGTAASPQIIGGDGVTAGYGFVQFNNMTKIPGGLSGGPIDIGVNPIDAGTITSATGIICDKLADGTNMGIQTTGIISSTLGAGSGLILTAGAEIGGPLKCSNSITVDTDKFIVSNTSGNIYTAGTLKVGSADVDANGDLTAPKTATINGDLVVNGNITSAASTDGVAKSVTFNSPLILKDVFTVDQNVNSVFKGTVTVGENANRKATSLFGTLTVKENVTAESNLSVNDGLTIEGAATFKKSVAFSAENDGSSTFDIGENVTTTISGTVTLGSEPTDDAHAATKKYVDDKGTGLDAENAITFPAAFTGTVKTNKLYVGDNGNLHFNDAPIKARLDTPQPVNLLTQYQSILNNNGIDADLKTALTGIISALADQIPETFDIGPPILAMTSDDVNNGEVTNAPITIKFTFSEVLATDLAADDLTIVNATMTNLAKDTDNSKVYTATLTAVADGDISVTLIDNAVEDSVGNQTTGATPFAYKHDGTDPTITTSSIASSNGTNTLAKSGDTITLTIVADEDIASPTVAFQSGGADVAGTVTVAAGDDDDATTWSASYVVADADTDGAVTISITATDLAGNEAAAHTTISGGSVTVDKTAPTVTIDTHPNNPTNSPSVTFQSDQAGSYKIQKSDDTEVIGSTNIDAGAANAVTADLSDLAAGTYSGMVITVTDAAGNSATATINDFVVDKTAPTVTIDTHPTTPSNSPEVTFQSDKAGNYKIMDGDTEVAGSTAITAGAANAVTFDLSALAEATYSGLVITVTDAAGNAGTATINDFVVDKTPPAISDITHPANPTNNPSVTFTSSKGGNYVIKKSDDSVVVTPNAIDASTATIVDLSALADGTYTDMVITVTDAAGNSGTATIDEFVVDTTDPAVQNVTHPDNPTNSPSVIFTSSKAASYKIMNGDTEVVGSTDIAASTATTVNFPNDFAEGDYTGMTINLTDAAGNTGSATINNFTVDKTAPSIGTNFAIVSNNGTDTSVAAVGDVVTVTITFDGAVATAPTMQYKTADSTDAFDAATAVNMTPATNDNITYTGTFTVAGGMGKLVQVTVTGSDDAAGNTMASESKSYGASSMTLLVSDPTITLDTTNATTDVTTDDAITLPTVTATDSAGNALTPTPTYSNGAISTNDTLAAGTYTINYNVNDAAGQSAAEKTFTVTVTQADNQAPTLSKTSFTSSNVTNPNSAVASGEVVTLVFTSDEAINGDPGVTFQVGGAAATGTVGALNKTADQNEWTITYTVAAGDTKGAVTAAVTGSDAAGNAATQLDVTGITYYKGITFANVTQNHEFGSAFTAVPPTGTDSAGVAVTVTGPAEAEPTNATAHNTTTVLTYTGTDPAGQTATATLTVTTADTTAPTLASGAALKDQSTFTLTFSEAIASITLDDIHIKRDDGSAFTDVSALTANGTTTVTGTWTGTFEATGVNDYIVEITNNGAILDANGLEAAANNNAITISVPA